MTGAAKVKLGHYPGVRWAMTKEERVATAKRGKLTVKNPTN
jgi:hypothetical protein